jgi:O-antigen/teichoic acid export membrane protein
VPSVRFETAGDDHLGLPSLEKTVATPEGQVLEAHPFRQHMGQVSRQSSVFFAGSIFTAAASYFFKIYLARFLGAESLGIYALGMTIVGFLGIFGSLGLPQSAVRFVAAYVATGRMDLLRAFVLRGGGLLVIFNALLSGLVLLIGPWVAVRFYHTPALRQYLGLFAWIMFLGALTTFLGFILVGYKSVARRTLITDFIGTPSMMVLTLIFVALGWSLWGYIFAQVLSALIMLALLVSVVWRTTPPQVRQFSGRPVPLERQVFWFSGVLFGMNTLGFLSSQADRVLIGFYMNAREVGIYSVAAAMVAFVPLILQSVNQIFSPTIADLHVRGEHPLLSRLYQTLTKWIFGLTIPLAAAVIIYARPLMRVFGSEFEAGWPILIIGTVGQLVNCGVGSVGYLLLMSGQERRMIRIQAGTAAIMVGLNILLIPRWGVTGAAVAAAVTNILTNLWYLRDVRLSLHLSPYNRSYFRLILPVGATFLCLGLLRWVPGDANPSLLSMAVGLILSYVAFTGTAILLGLDADDRIIADAVWARVRRIGGAEART